MLPHEKALVERTKDEPFALIGVNCYDGSREAVAPRLAKEGINWRNAIDEAGTYSVAERWNVNGFPQLYLIDHAGVIREKWLGSPGDEVLDRKIDQLVLAAKTAR